MCAVRISFDTGWCGQSGNRYKDGMNSKQALLRNMRICRSDVKGEVQVVTPQGESTNAEHRGGPSRSSDETPVMGVERRGWLVQFKLCCQPAMG